MVSRFHAWRASHSIAARQSFRALWGAPFATCMTSLVIAMALVLPALFWVFVNNMQELAPHFQQPTAMSLYLKLHVSADEQAALLTRVRAVAGVEQALLVSPEEALVQLQQQDGLAEVLASLPANPLPAVIQVTPARSLQSPQQLEGLYHRLAALPDVDDATFDRQWVHQLHTLLDTSGQLAYVVMVILGGTLLFIVGNTLQLAIQNRQEEIDVLQLIGASDAFISRPFLYRGFWYGLAGGLLALLVVELILMGLSAIVMPLTALYALNPLPLHGLSFIQMVLLLVIAISIACLGARLSIKRVLKNNLPKC